MNILIVSKITDFENNILDCLKEYQDYNVYIRDDISKNFSKFVQKKHISVIILNLLYKRRKRDLVNVVKQKVKLVVLENGNDLYQQNMSLPFSVFKKLRFRSEKSKTINENEKIIKARKDDYIIFRISEVYGPSIRYGLIYDLFHKNRLYLNDGERDFIYEGDLICAIERAIQCDATGVFDIAFGESINTQSLISKVNEIRDKKIKIVWQKQKENIRYDCENFKFYKWQPLVDFETGLKVIKNSRKKYI